jgi:hypothetical protein
VCGDPRVDHFFGETRTYQIVGMAYPSQRGYISYDDKKRKIALVKYSDRAKFNDNVKYDWSYHSWRTTDAISLRCDGVEKEIEFEIRPKDIDYIITVVITIKKEKVCSNSPRLRKR